MGEGIAKIHLIRLDGCDGENRTDAEIGTRRGDGWAHQGEAGSALLCVLSSCRHPDSCAETRAYSVRPCQCVAGMRRKPRGHAVALRCYCPLAPGSRPAPSAHGVRQMHGERLACSSVPLMVPFTGGPNRHRLERLKF